MSYRTDGVEVGTDQHVNYEPSNRNGPKQQEAKGPPPRPYVEGHIGRQKISRTNDFFQAGERYRSFEDWEREELIANLIGALSQCDRIIQEKMVHHFTLADADYGRRVAEGLGIGQQAQAAE
jgi:catalase